MGHNGNNSLLKRMRAQGNFIEYAPFGVILLALVEFSGAPPVMNGPVFGMILTLMIILLSALGLLLHTLF